MTYLRLFAVGVLTAVTLSGCSSNPVQTGPLGEAETVDVVGAVTQQLTAALRRSANDEALIALMSFPQDDGLDNPLFGYGVGLFSFQQRALQAFADYDLPRGHYRYTHGSGWVLEAASDDLSATWRYDPEPTGTGKRQADATLTFDWDAGGPTAEVRDSSGQLYEVPTGLNLTLVADAQEVADLDATSGYYQAPGCGDDVDGILEPTSLMLSGTSSLVELAGVGYTLQETAEDATLSTRGTLTLTDERLALEWDVALTGQLERFDCHIGAVGLERGTVALELSGLTGDTASVALAFAFEGLDTGSEIRDGSFVVNGDESRAVTFGGPLSDSDGNGTPGDDLTVRFADGTETTLEQLFSDLAGTVGVFLALP